MCLMGWLVGTFAGFHHPCSDHSFCSKRLSVFFSCASGFRVATARARGAYEDVVRGRRGTVGGRGH